MMRRLWLRYGVWCLAAAVMVAGSGSRAQGQSPDEQEPGMGLRGGQMIRGTVTAAVGDRLSIKTNQGDAYQVTVTTNTRMMKDRQPVRVADVKVGDNVGAMGVLDAPTKTVHAVFVMVVDAEEAKKAREGLGKVYISGKVTAIDELKLTILRPDGVSQVIAVDEGTSFKKGGRQMQALLTGSGPMPMGDGAGGGARAGRGGGAGSGAGGAGTPEGESITLADIKVGDGVIGKGELKGGVFVPSELGVMDAARQRRRRPDGAAAPGGAGPSGTAGTPVPPPEPR